MSHRCWCDHSAWHCIFINPRKYSSKQILIKWNFPLQPAGGNYTLLSGTKTTLSSEGSHLWMLVHNLVPCSHYMVQVNASNSQSSILSDPMSVEIHPAGEFENYCQLSDFVQEA